jgi:hypothetical protein
VRELIPELAMGVASGEVRAQALAHLAGCAACRRELEDVAVAIDELLLLAPEQEPPAGFDARVLAELEQSRPRREVGRILLMAAALVVVAVVAAGATWWHGTEDRNLAGQYRETLAVADGRYLRAADLTAGGKEVGHVFAYQGSPSWLFVTIEAGPPGRHGVRLVTTDGHAINLGTCRVREDGTGSWGTTIDLPLTAIDRVVLFRDGRTTMTAEW